MANLNRKQICRVVEFITPMSTVPEFLQFFVIFFTMTGSVKFSIEKSFQACEDVMDDQEQGFDLPEVIDFMDNWNIDFQLEDGSDFKLLLDGQDYFQNAIGTTNASVNDFIEKVLAEPIPERKKRVVQPGARISRRG